MINYEAQERMRTAYFEWLDNTGKEMLKMLDQQKIAREVFNLTKNYCLNAVKMLTTFQEQNEKMWNSLLNEGVIVQQSNQKMLQEWLTHAKQAREHFQKTIEDNIKQVESNLGTGRSGK